MSEEGENNRPKRVIKAASALETANAFGALPGDVPVVAPTPLIDAGAARPATSLDASRLVLPPNDTLWAFAATGSVDQPARRFRPPDQSLCVGGGGRHHGQQPGAEVVERDQWGAAAGACLPTRLFWCVGRHVRPRLRL